MIRAVVRTGQFSDPQAEKHLADVLIQRRDKITRTYLPQVNPIVNPRIDTAGLVFENAADASGVAGGPVSYTASWMRFDNATGATTALSETKSTTTTVALPSGLPATGFVAVDLSADSAGHPNWKRPVRAVFQRQGAGWKLVGLERLPARLEQDTTGASERGTR
jgi:hypothetical protein